MRYGNAICLSVVLLAGCAPERVEPRKDITLHVSDTAPLSSCLESIGFIQAWTETEYAVWMHVDQPVYLVRKDDVKAYPAIRFLVMSELCRNDMLTK